MKVSEATQNGWKAGSPVVLVSGDNWFCSHVTSDYTLKAAVSPSLSFDHVLTYYKATGITILDCGVYLKCVCLHEVVLSSY